MEKRINIIQGEFAVSDDPHAVITTLLGSCVAACLYDPVAKVGGMNHFLLPGDEDGSATAVRYGVHLMELLLNGLFKKGAGRERLQAKLFGGARTVQVLSDIGVSNIHFARRFLAQEGIAQVGGSVGGDAGRRLQFWPVTGRARQALMTSPDQLPAINLKVPAAAANWGDLELF